MVFYSIEHYIEACPVYPTPVCKPIQCFPYINFDNNVSNSAISKILTNFTRFFGCLRSRETQLLVLKYYWTSSNESFKTNDEYFYKIYSGLFNRRFWFGSKSKGGDIKRWNSYQQLFSCILIPFHFSTGFVQSFKFQMWLVKIWICWKLSWIFWAYVEVMWQRNLRFSKSTTLTLFR